MSVARNTFLQRVGGLRSAVSNAAIVATAIAPNPEVLAAQLFRNGLAVISFTILEDFLRSRVAEVVTAAATSPAPFAAIPVSLRELLTVGVIKGLREQLEHARRNGVDVVQFVQTHAKFVASTVGPPYSFSDFGFGRERSNISWEDIESLFQAFQIDNTAQALGSVAARVASGTFVAKSFFNDLSKIRHKSAHDATSAVQALDLQSYPTNLTNFGLVFDSVLSGAAIRLKTADSRYLSGTPVAGKDIRLRLIEESVKGKWRELVPGATGTKRARRISTNEQTAVQLALPIALGSTETLVVRDKHGILKGWYMPAL